MGTNAWILHMLVICIAVLLHNLIELRRGRSDKGPVAHENWFDQRKTLHNRDSVIESKPEVIAHGFTYSPVSIRITNFSWRTRFPLQCVLYTGSRLLAVCFSHVISAGVMRGDVLDKKGVGRFLLVHATLLCSCSQINSRLTLKEDRLPAGRTKSLQLTIMLWISGRRSTLI